MAREPRDERVAERRGQRRAAGGGLRGLIAEIGLDVLFGDASAGAGAFHAREVDVVLAGHLADQRRNRPGGLGRRRRARARRARAGRRPAALCPRPVARQASGSIASCAGRLGLRRGRSGRLGRRGAAALFDTRHDGVDADGLAFLDHDFGQRPGGGRRNFGVDLVGGDLEERLVAFDALAGLFQPFGQGAFYDAFAHLGHHYVGHVSSLFRVQASWQATRICPARLAIENRGRNERAETAPSDFVQRGADAELRHRGHGLRQAARNDVLEIAQVGVDVQREAVRRHPPADMHADGGDLSLAHPDAGEPGNAAGLDAVLGRPCR